MKAPPRELLIAVTGGIAAYKACDLTRNLSKRGVPVRVMMTRNAERFVSALTLETLSGRKVYTDNWDEGMLHIYAKNESVLMAVVPATSNIIGKFANGIADDVVTSTYLASRSPVIVAPSMNPFMYAHPAVKRNLARLREDGVEIIEPQDGEAVDGDSGPGKLADIGLIEDRLYKRYHELVAE